jgi:hypothetical protein
VVVVEGKKEEEKMGEGEGEGEGEGGGCDLAKCSIRFATSR